MLKNSGNSQLLADSLKRHLDPVFKWTGGKRRELPVIEQYYPNFVKENQRPYNYVEPFVGAGAVYWSLDNLKGTNIINDFDEDVTLFYKAMKHQQGSFLADIGKTCLLYDKKLSPSHEKQEKNYYQWRVLDRNGGLTNLNIEKRASRFWIINQLAFSGMRRFNSKGEFNVPYGHYKSLNNHWLSEENHVALLKDTTILNGDYANVVLENDRPNTFIFVDPPYTEVMRTYSAGNTFSDQDQVKLAKILTHLKFAKFMIVINSSEFTRSLYFNQIKCAYPMNYGVNIKNRFPGKTEHFIATNY